MKKLLIGLLLIITTQSFGQVVWPKVPPTFQQFGSSTTWSQFNGTVYPVVGFITPTYDDTTVANGNGYAKFMPFNIISTSDGGFWRRNFAATKWEEISIGGTPSTPTWQQTLTAGSTLTGNNTIAGGGFSLRFLNNDSAVFEGSKILLRDITTNSVLQMIRGSIYVGSDLVTLISTARDDSISVGNGYATITTTGAFKINGLTNLSTQDRLLGIRNSTGQIGNVTLGSGLSLSSGVLNTSGTVPTPISSLTAATGTNSIDNTTFGQSWSWTNLVSTGLSLTSASTAAPAGTTHKILSITASGANATASASTFGVFSANTHTGTNSTNYGVYGSSSNGTLNVGTVGISSGGTTSIGGQFSSSGGTTNYGVTGSVTGAATTNYGAEFSASGGTTNNALNIAAGALTLNGSAGTSGQVLTSAGASTLPTWTTPSTVATAVPLSGITAATGSNSINNGSNAQTWNWPTLTNGIGLLLTSLASTTGTTGGSVLTVLRSGSLSNASQTTYGAIIQNQHTGTTETNVGLKVEATGGTNNYALVIPSGSGNVGIGTATPSQLLHVNGVAQIGTAGSTLGELNLSGNTSGTITIKGQAAAGTYNFNLPTTAGTSGYFLTSGGGSGTAMTWTDPASISGLPYWPLTGSATLSGNVDIDMNISVFSLTNPSGNGTTFSMTDGGGGSAYFDNTAHDVKLGINTTTPAGVLDVKANSGAIDALFVDATSGNVGIGTSAPNSTLNNNGSFAGKYTATATGITLDATNYVVNVTATGQTITLPDAAGIEGRIYTIKLTASGSCTVATTSSQTIDAGTTYSLASQYKYVSVMSNNANWIVIGNN